MTYELEHRFPATIELALAAMIFAIVVGVPLGLPLGEEVPVAASTTRASSASLIGISIPIFFLAIILKYIFCRPARLAPEHRSRGRAQRGGAPDELLRPRRDHRRATSAASWDAIKHLILPAIALGSIPLAIISRITRASVLDVQNEDYVRTARAKGLAPRTVDRRHVMRNALLPVTTIIGLQMGLLLSGAVLTETVFAIPGMGSWLKEAIFNRDYPVLQGGILFLAVVFVFVNLLVDITYALMNPRIRVS